MRLFSGPSEIRTHDLLNAIETRSQLRYRPMIFFFFRSQLKWTWGDSNPRPLQCDWSALPTALQAPISWRHCLFYPSLLFCQEKTEKCDSKETIGKRRYAIFRKTIRYAPSGPCFSGGSWKKTDHREYGSGSFRGEALNRSLPFLFFDNFKKTNRNDNKQVV